jgi:hypothetical protein
MKAKQLSAEGALDVGVDRNGNEWHVSYREENRNEACGTEESDFTYTNLSFRPKESSRRLGSLGVGLNFELAIPGDFTSDGKPWGIGRSYDLMADAENNLNLFRTNKTTPARGLKNSFGFSLSLEFSLTIGSKNNYSPLNENLVGPGFEKGVGSGPFGYSVSSNIEETYRKHSIKLGGNGIDFGITDWNTFTKMIK